MATKNIEINQEQKSNEIVVEIVEKSEQNVKEQNEQQSDNEMQDIQVENAGKANVDLVEVENKPKSDKEVHQQIDDKQNKAKEQQLDELSAENDGKQHEPEKVVAAEVLAKNESQQITIAAENSKKNIENKCKIVADENNDDEFDIKRCKMNENNDIMTTSTVENTLTENVDIIKKDLQDEELQEQNIHVKHEKVDADELVTKVNAENQIKIENTNDQDDVTAVVTAKIEKLEKDDISTATEEKIDLNKISSLKTLGPFIAAKNNSCNTIYINDFPEICKKQPCILGVDEAGRGPVLGPMVYGIAFCPCANEQALVDLGCADSKQLTEQKREMIFNDINTLDYARDSIGWAVEIISPNVISTSMNRRSKCSLNEVSMNSAIGLINLALDAGVNVVAIYVDTVGPPEKYEQKLKALFPNVEKITVAKKADSTYPIVSAASICAKVTRDHALKVWKFPEGIELTAKEFGSGYPGDPVTKQFLSNNIDHVFGFPRLVRFSWSTAENALADVAYEMEFDEPDSEKTTIKYTGAKLTQFFKQQAGQIGKNSGGNGSVKRQLCRFYKERFLNNVTEF